jgi:phenylacetate-CoA ligase
MSAAANGFPDHAGLEAYQLEQLNRLVTVLSAGNPFYAGRLDAAGIESEFSTLAEFFRRVGFTSKQEVVEDQLIHPPYGSNLTYPLERYTRFFQTSGTTSGPMRWLDTPESWDWMLNCWERVYRSADVTARDHIFFAFSFGPFLGFWTAFESAQRLGCLVVPGGGMRSAARLRTMLDTAATVLCCTPTYAIRLAEVAAGEGIDLFEAKVKRIIVGGEPGGSIPRTRARIEELWPGARVVDHHGMTEIGPVSYGCPKRPEVLHIIGSAYIAEVVDPQSGRAVPAGGTGELVLTNLGRLGSPILRYRTGDLVQRAPDGPCDCGTSELGLEGGILGRTDDMLVVRGVNIYPSTVENLLRGFDDVAEYRVEVRTGQALPELSVQVEPSPDNGDAAALVRRLETVLNNALGLRVSVSSVACGTLPRYEMKADRWVRR